MMINARRYHRNVARLMRVDARIAILERKTNLYMKRLLDVREEKKRLQKRIEEMESEQESSSSLPASSLSDDTENT